MYETYVSDATGERRPPTIADIVREKTDGGARIVDFFLDLMEGRVDDAKLCHRIDAAKQLVKYGHKGAADYIAYHSDEPCDHCESRKRGPRSRKEAHTTPGVLHAQLITYDFINLLTEDFLTVLSAVDEDLMIRLVRAQTNHCETVVEFLDAVMYNRVDGFKANHRIAAARELISHIVRDEQRSHTPCPIESAPYSIRRPGLKPANLVRAEDASVPSTPLEPAPYSIRGAGFKPALPGAARKPGLSTIPEKCLRPEQLVVGTHPVAARTTLVPAKSLPRTRNGAGTHPVRPEPVEGLAGPKVVRPEPVEGPVPTEGSADPQSNSSVVPAKAGTQRNGGIHDTAANPPNGVGTHPVHPEPVEEPALSLSKGPSSQPTTNNQQLRTPPTPGRSPPG